MRTIPDPGDGRKWRRVTARRPCPVCDKPDWCLVAADGTAAICQRTEGPKRCGDAGWLHRLADPVPTPPPPRKRPRPATDWPAAAARFAAALSADRKADLVAHLGLPADSLDALPFLGWAGDDPGGACWTFPEESASGVIVGITRRYSDGSKKAMAGGKRGLTVPAGWRDRPGPVLLAEGPSDVLAATAAGLACVGRPSNTGGAAALAGLLADWPPDRHVLVVGENDRKDDGRWPGRDGAAVVARELAGTLGRPVRCVLPPADTKDCRAWLTAPARAAASWPDRGRDLLAAFAVVDDSPGPGPAPPGRPEIVLGADEYRVNAQAVEALAADPDVYQRGGLLVRVLDQTDDPEPSAAVRRPVGLPVVRDLPRPLLREVLTRRAAWVRVKETKDGDQSVTAAHPPDWCVGAVHARGRWPGVRPLTGVVTHPILLPDGAVLAADGYHPPTGLLARLPPGLAVTVPDTPTRADVAAAVAALCDPLADFPFADPAHRAALVAGLLTPLAWHLFDGPAPLFLIDKNVRGAGAGLLADVVALTVTGRRFPVMSYSNDRDELRKRITTLAIEGERLVLLDNLAGAVGNDVLDAALTADTWKDRVLGSNAVYDGPLHVVWFGTGNNVQLAADTARRVCHVRMETTDERPETRTGFRHPDLRAHVRAHRGRLLSAALTVLRGWVVAGRPTHGLVPWGSYEGWSGVAREAVVFAGLPDPGETRAALQTSADRDAAAMAEVLTGLERLDPHRRGVTAAEVVARAKTADGGPDWLFDLRAAVEDLCGKLDARALGYRFRHFARRTFDGRVLDRAGEDRLRGNRWAVYPAGGRGRSGGSPASPASPASPTGDAGDAGDPPGYPGATRPDPRPAPARLFDSFDDQMLPD